MADVELSDVLFDFVSGAEKRIYMRAGLETDPSLSKIEMRAGTTEGIIPNVSLYAGDGKDEAWAAGSIGISAGAAALGGGNGGDVSISAGWAAVSGAGGSVTLYGGWSAGANSAGNVQLQAGSDQDTSGKGASLLLGGWDTADNLGGSVELLAGDNTDNASGDGGNIAVTAGNGNNGTGTGGTITLTVGTGDTNGQLIFLNVPGGDPGILGAVWNDAGVLKISAGV